MAVSAEDLAALLHRVGKLVEDSDGVVPVDACIRDADAVLQTLLALLGNLLVA